MKTKENSKRVLLTDEELMGVVGGLVQLINPSSSVGYRRDGKCSNYGKKEDCKKDNDCKWDKQKACLPKET